VLCEHNPHRRCNVNFAPKYLVNDILKAKCEAPIRVEIIDRATGVPVGEEIPDVQLEARHCFYCNAHLLTATARARIPVLLRSPAFSGVSQDGAMLVRF
jgi:hypothetical protein